MAEIEPIRVFGGINRSLDPHLLSEGDYPDAKNYHSQRGPLEKRLGFQTSRDLLITEGKMYWPSVLYHFDFPSNPENDTDTIQQNPGGTDTSREPIDAFGNGGVFFVPPNRPKAATALGDPWAPDVLGMPPVGMPPVEQNNLLSLTPVMADFLKEAAPFDLTVTARFEDGTTDTAFVGVDARLTHDILLSSTGASVGLDVLTLAAGGAIDITIPGDWTAGVWTKSVKFVDDFNGDRLVVISDFQRNGGGIATSQIGCEGLAKYVEWLLNDDTFALTAADTINGNPGILSGNVVFTGSEAVFDGIMAHIVTNFCDPITGDFTFTIDIAWDESVPSNNRLFSIDGIELYWTTVIDKLVLNGGTGGVPGGDTQQTSDTDYSGNVRRIITVARVGTNLKIFVGGALEFEKTVTVPTLTRVFIAASGGGNWMPCIIHEMKIVE